MCRLYAFRSNEPTKVECTLVLAQNALLSQSRRDARGVDHSDGWGIAAYPDGEPHVERKATAAFEDSHFSATAERLHARTVLAHVRRATVGGPMLENCHPFRRGRWTFAHNGTVSAFEALEPRLLEETDADLRAARRGTTDSELVFLWLLTRLRRAGVSLEGSEPAAGTVAEVLEEAVRVLDERCAREDPAEPARLNLVLTDGRVLVASRLGNTLHWVERRGVHDCEVCGIPHVWHEEGRLYRAVVVASEPISDEPWREVPEGAVLAVDRRAEVALVPA